jgi:TatD-related deoxyribonuclease
MSSGKHDLYFADAHCHSSPKGLGAYRIAEKFKSVGGWFMAFVTLPPWHYVADFKPTLDNYERSFQIFLQECKEAKKSGLKISCLAGFHPAEVDKLIGMGLKPEEVLALGFKVLEIIEDFCKRGIIDGVGEIGRQHYKTMPERFAIAEIIMLRGLEIARDHDCIVHLHLENAGSVTVDTIAKLASFTDIRFDKIVFHHASLKVAKRALEIGARATLPGKLELLRSAFRSLEPKFMVESDYIDDPRRPCVSSCPWEIVEAQRTLLREGSVDKETLAKINIDNIVETYGVEPP